MDLDPYQTARKAKRDQEEFDRGFEERVEPYVVVPRSDYSASERSAYELGREHGLNAASWVVDGNTKPETIAALVRMFDDGDPEIEQHLPRCPDLSGEWGDGPTPSSLVEAFAPDVENAEVATALTEAYEDGVRDTFEIECERLVRQAAS